MQTWRDHDSFESAANRLAHRNRLSPSTLYSSIALFEESGTLYLERFAAAKSVSGVKVARWLIIPYTPPSIR
jgi:hypothetical protein